MLGLDARRVHRQSIAIDGLTEVVRSKIPSTTLTLLFEDLHFRHDKCSLSSVGQPNSIDPALDLEQLRYVDTESRSRTSSRILKLRFALDDYCDKCVHASSELRETS